MPGKAQQPFPSREIQTATTMLLAANQNCQGTDRSPSPALRLRSPHARSVDALELCAGMSLVLSMPIDLRLAHHSKPEPIFLPDPKPGKSPPKLPERPRRPAQSPIHVATSPEPLQQPSVLSVNPRFAKRHPKTAVFLEPF